MDSIASVKEDAKAMFAGFHAIEMMMGTASPRLVRFAGIKAGDRVLDVGCGTGVLSLTAARTGADVTGVDLSPELIAHAKRNAELMGLAPRFLEGDVEALPFEDASFDVVVSQFGHMYAPRPDVAIREMLRVLRPGGTIAFATWPPEGNIGQALAMPVRFGLPVPEGMPSPSDWGVPSIVQERLGEAVKDLAFNRDAIFGQILSPQHARFVAEQSPGPLSQLSQRLAKENPAKLEEMRREIEAVASVFFEDNQLRYDYLLSRAVKV